MAGAIVLMILVGVAGLFRPTTESSGVNYVIARRRIPLYHKLLGFLHRDAEYRFLARSITQGIDDPEEKMERIFAWVTTHLHVGSPQGFPVYDDHIWYTIVRGYGEEDQITEVFALLSAYAGLENGIVRLAPAGQPPDAGISISVAAVKLRGDWKVVDPARRVIVRDQAGSAVSLTQLVNLGPWRRELPDDLVISGFPYADYLDTIDEETAPDPQRLQLQMPWRRLVLEARAAMLPQGIKEEPAR